MQMSVVQVCDLIMGCDICNVSSHSLQCVAELVFKSDGILCPPPGPPYCTSLDTLRVTPLPSPQSQFGLLGLSGWLAWVARLGGWVVILVGRVARLAVFSAVRVHI